MTDNIILQIKFKCQYGRRSLELCCPNSASDKRFVANVRACFVKPLAVDAEDQNVNDKDEGDFLNSDPVDKRLWHLAKFIRHYLTNLFGLKRLVDQQDWDLIEGWLDALQHFVHAMETFLSCDKHREDTFICSTAGRQQIPLLRHRNAPQIQCSIFKRYYSSSDIGPTQYTLYYSPEAPSSTGAVEIQIHIQDQSQREVQDGWSNYGTWHN
ncbi:uncharacterized protein PITG_13400 [Phytophthora infestans T30-4]|uniref:Uncharacterized protein n=1 Tax=Phytophthora infestans (strain T30-4) TaxID=403677 RepID=D0NLW6_PHYIT|nr:uncharacterized protein PITG_13400 [Phytophthora infestans T30-4]EEY60663.1 hypothetical protein PITG_13400 [Phytophthora infestans T30-4]|eukprot:XP_002900036.1 hypothetical protein PITG_13400 [Phytophthora infestans T30-4]